MTAFSEKLAEEVRVLEAVLGDSVENATGDETKSEGKYDTRATEAAYLAEGQRARLEGLRETRHYFGSLILKAFVATEEVGAGALVEIEDAVGNLTFYLLLKKGGGLSAEFLGCEAR